MRALITGADGFVGQWLIRELLEAGDIVFGGARSRRMALHTLGEIASARVEWRQVDLSDAESLTAAVRDARPDAVYHLAAQSSVPASIADPADTLEVNLMGTLRMLEACRREAPDAAIIVVGSADAYGNADPALMS